MRFRHHMSQEVGLKNIEITPLIDCVFLLLVFFMLTSNFVVTPAIKINLPRAETGSLVGVESTIIVVSSEDIVYIGDKVFTYKELERYLKGTKKKRVFIRADRNASLGAVVRIWDICRKLGIDKIDIATTYFERRG